MRRLFPALAGIALSAAAFAAAPTPVGSWTGKIGLPGLPANATAQQKQQMQMAMAMVTKFKFTLNVKADKTCLITIANPQTNKPTTQTGKWSQAGNKVTFVNSKGKDAHPMTAFLSANGKTMTAQVPQGKGSLVFTKN
ncbi:hypothetical protein BH11ARM2_BH11ARM2_32460 [soil metagenome]